MNAPVNDPVNLGNLRELTLLGLAKQVVRMSESKSKIVYRACPPTIQRCASRTSAARAGCSGGSR